MSRFSLRLFTTKKWLFLEVWKACIQCRRQVHGRPACAHFGVPQNKNAPREILKHFAKFAFFVNELCLPTFLRSFAPFRGSCGTTHLPTKLPAWSVLWALPRRGRAEHLAGVRLPCDAPKLAGGVLQSCVGCLLNVGMLGSHNFTKFHVFETWIFSRCFGWNCKISQPKLPQEEWPVADPEDCPGRREGVPPIWHSTGVSSRVMRVEILEFFWKPNSLCSLLFIKRFAWFCALFSEMFKLQHHMLEQMSFWLPFSICWRRRMEHKGWNRWKSKLGCCFPWVDSSTFFVHQPIFNPDRNFGDVPANDAFRSRPPKEIFRQREPSPNFPIYFENRVEMFFCALWNLG